MRFTQNWFEITARDNFIKYLGEFKGKSVRFLEIGCFEGMATRWMLEHVLDGEFSRIDVVDTFEGSEEHTRDNLEVIGRKGFEENIVGFEDRVTIHQGYSQKILRYFEFDAYDFIYVDGSHRACDAFQDIALSWDLLKSGGIMIFDDYAWNNFSDHLNACIAIDAFLNCFVGKYELLLKEYQVVLRKL